MRMTRFVGPVILAFALALGACSTTSGTAQQEQVPAQEGAPTAEGDTTTDPSEGVDNGDSDPAGSSETFGSRDAPLTPDVAVDLGAGWTVQVSASNLDAWSQIEEIDGYMDAPEAGRVYVSAAMAITFDGSGPADPGFDLSYAFIGSRGNTFTDMDDCTPYEVALWNVGDMYSGAQAEALICVSVPEDQAEDGVWRIQLFDIDAFTTVEAYYSTS